MRRYDEEDGIQLFIEGYSKGETIKAIHSPKTQLLVGIWFSYHYPFDIAVTKTKEFLSNHGVLNNSYHSKGKNISWLTSIYHYVTDNYFTTIYDATNHFFQTDMIQLKQLHN